MNFVYLTTNLKNKKQYIGSHSGQENDNYIGSGDIIIKARRKYGFQNFKKEILEVTETREEAFLLEEKYINLYKTHVSQGGYNISWTGGMGNWGGKHSEETKKILSEKRKGKSPWNKNKTGLQSHSEETKLKLSLINSGKLNKMYGKKGNNCPSYGLKRSNETKNKMKASKLEGNNPNAKKYLIIPPDNIEYIVDSATEFITNYPQYGINRHFIYYQANKNNKQLPNKWYIKEL